MEWQIIVALVVAVSVMLLPGTVVWYLHDQRVRDMIQAIVPRRRRSGKAEMPAANAGQERLGGPIA